MKRFFLLVVTVLLLHNGITLAQNIEITVLNKNSQPIPYAYILVNNKPVEVSDTMGIAIIPLNKLMDNDTISISYLGALPAWIIYNQSIKESKKYAFYLDESFYNLNEVVVTYQDIEKLFRKSIKSVPVLNYSCKMDAKFNAKITYTNQTAYDFFGTMQAINDMRFTPKYYGWFDPPVKFMTDSDTTIFGRLLNAQTHLAFFFSNRSVSIWQSSIKLKSKPFYSYLGEKDNYKVFRISYPQTYIVGFYYQIILYVDKNTKYIRSVEIEAFNKEPDKNNNLHKFSVTFDCELFTRKKPKMNTIYLPVNVHYCYEVVDQMKFELNISDVSIK